MYKKIISISALVLFLVACGGGGGGGDTDSTTGNDNNNNNGGGETISVKENINSVELGPVSGSTVVISTIDTKESIYTTITDDKGKYSIDLDLFKSNLNALSTYPEYVLVTSTGGVDIDPEDDGDTTNSDSIFVNGSVKGIFKTTTLLNNEDLSINLLSTAVTELIKDKEKIDDEQLAYIIKELGVIDINGDGVVDNQDVYLYKMSEHDSAIEDKLRENYLTAIHTGDDNKIDELNEALATEYNLMFINYTISNGQAYLDIEKAKKDTQILYAINAEKDDILNSIYSDSIILSKDDFVVYKECKDDSCSSIQIASFDGEKLYQYYLRISNFGIFNNEEEVETLRIQINQDTKARDEKEEKLLEMKSKIQELKDKLQDLRK